MVRLLVGGAPGVLLLLLLLDVVDSVRAEGTKHQHQGQNPYNLGRPVKGVGVGRGGNERGGGGLKGMEGVGGLKAEKYAI